MREIEALSNAVARLCYTQGRCGIQTGMSAFGHVSPPQSSERAPARGALTTLMGHDAGGEDYSEFA